MHLLKIIFLYDYSRGNSADKFEEIKIDDEIKVTGLQLESTGNHRDVITYDETNDEWTTGEISGQLEYIGT